MQALLADVPLQSLQLLRKVTEKAIEGGENEKFRTLRRSNDTCRTQLFNVQPALEVLHVIGWADTSEGISCTESILPQLKNALSAIETALAERDFHQQKEYEERKAFAAAKATEIQKRKVVEESQKEAELKKIKAIQSDVRDRVIKASIADPTMGRSKEAEGIFAGAGGRSSSAKTFKDLGVSLQ
jgi:hypothetical protein